WRLGCAGLRADLRARRRQPLATDRQRCLAAASRERQAAALRPGVLRRGGRPGRRRAPARNHLEAELTRASSLTTVAPSFMLQAWKSDRLSSLTVETGMSGRA